MQALFCQCYHTLELWAFFQLRFLNNKFGNGAAWLHRETSEYGNNIRESQQKGGVKRQPVPKCWQTCNTSHTLLRTKCRITLGVCTRLEGADKIPLIFLADNVAPQLWLLLPPFSWATQSLFFQATCQFCRLSSSALLSYSYSSLGILAAAVVKSIWTFLHNWLYSSFSFITDFYFPKD